jgi:hypothetical protein
MRHGPTEVTIVLDAYPMEFVNAWADELMQVEPWQGRHRGEVVSYVLNQAVLLASAAHISEPDPGDDPPAD